MQMDTRAHRPIDGPGHGARVETDEDQGIRGSRRAQDLRSDRPPHTGRSQRPPKTQRSARGAARLPPARGLLLAQTMIR